MKDIDERPEVISTLKQINELNRSIMFSGKRVFGEKYETFHKALFDLITNVLESEHATTK